MDAVQWSARRPARSPRARGRRAPRSLLRLLELRLPLGGPVLEGGTGPSPEPLDSGVAHGSGDLSMMVPCKRCGKPTGRRFPPVFFGDLHDDGPYHQECFHAEHMERKDALEKGGAAVRPTP